MFKSKEDQKKKEIGTIAVLLQRLNEFRLPRALRSEEHTSELQSQ